ncbi:MAG TPA: DoxX family protein [Gemmatimonadales bacterium]|nr:DoxX family protein [Gemmatimonadales bacterium]
MNLFLWILQGLAALLYGASGVMKVFLFDRVSGDVPSFGALPRQAWAAFGIVELLCVVGLIVPAALRWHPRLTVLAAAILAVESLVFIWVHVQYREVPSMVMSGVLGLVMVFVAYGRAVLAPLR